MPMPMLILAMMTGGHLEAATPPAPAAAPAAERRICRTDVNLGTILPRRVCRPAGDWAQIDAAQGKITERDTDHMRNSRRDSMAERPGT
jgi:hypothetical protein